jgi:hypothetical protein
MAIASDRCEPRGDIDAIGREVAVALLDDVANVNPDAEFDSTVLRPAGVALDEAVLDLDRAADRIHDAAKLDDRSVAGPLDDTAMMHGDGRIDQVAPKGPKPCEDAIFVRASKPGVADNVGHQDRS